MKRLSGMDAMFLSMEGTEWPQHTLGLMILDPSDAPGFDFEHLRDHLDRRLPYLPSFRRRIQEVPLGLDRPVWVDDPAFKLDYHIHRAALPAPGGAKELADVVGEILAVEDQHGILVHAGVDGRDVGQILIAGHGLRNFLVVPPGRYRHEHFRGPAFCP